MARLISSILPKDGYHPTFLTKISFTEPNLSKISNCTLHLHFTLPSLVFVDTYELAHHEEFYTFHHWGTSNLELPVTAVPQKNASLLLTVKSTCKNTREVEVKLPLHLRYGDSTRRSSTGYVSTDMEWPTGFLACPRPGTILSSSSSSSSSPYIPQLPVDAASLFDPSTHVFVPIASSGTSAVETVRVPVGNARDLAFVEVGTAVVVLLSFLYLSRVSWILARKLSMSSVQHQKVD